MSCSEGQGGAGQIVCKAFVALLAASESHSASVARTRASSVASSSHELCQLLHEADRIHGSSHREVLRSCVKYYELDGCRFEPNAALRTAQVDYLGELQFALSDPPDKPESGATIGTISYTKVGHN